MQMQMQPVYFKISRTDISKTYPINVDWTCTQFNDIMKYAIYLNFGHQRVEFVKTMQGNDTVRAEDFEGLSDSTMTLKDKFPEDIANKKLAFYIRILEEEDEEDEEEVDESIVREYVEKVGDTGQSSEGKMAGTGAKTPATGGKNTKSVVAGKNDMGGTAVTSHGGNANQDGNRPAASEKPKGELVSNPQNKPGANAGKTAFKTKEAQQGGQEGKLAGADGSRPINKVSPVAKK